MFFTCARSPPLLFFYLSLLPRSSSPPPTRHGRRIDRSITDRSSFRCFSFRHEMHGSRFIRSPPVIILLLWVSGINTASRRDASLATTVGERPFSKKKNNGKRRHLCCCGLGRCPGQCPAHVEQARKAAADRHFWAISDGERARWSDPAQILALGWADGM